MRGDLFEAACCEDAGPPPIPFVPPPPPPPPPPLRSPLPSLLPPTNLTDSRRRCASDAPQHDAQTVYKDVVIIGNGPSAICLSYMLAGNWPYYGDDIHPIDFLHYRLDSFRSQSLLEQDLMFLCEGLEGRSNNPVSVLFDTLNHVNADLGVDTPSFLRWIRRPPEDEIDHVVLGRAFSGGSWQSMDQSSLTLSLSNWMELPNFHYKQFEQERLRSKNISSGGKQSRALVADVAQYYREYVKVQLLEKYFYDHTVVTSVRRTRDEEDELRGYYWEVFGYSTWNQEPFRYVTPNVVLATGVSDIPKRLRVPGEDLPFVLHSSTELEYLIADRRLGPLSDPLMVIGAGLTAADSIINARFFGVPVVHVFRCAVDDPDLIFRKLDENMYPEYHNVYKMMIDGSRDNNNNGHRGYRSYPQHQVLDILPGGKVRLEDVNRSIVLKVSHVLVLIGSWPNLSFLGSDAGSRLATNPSHPIDCKHNTIVIDAYSHESAIEDGLFALGPLVGDNFVRFLQGGALAVANRLVHDRDERMRSSGLSGLEPRTSNLRQESGDKKREAGLHESNGHCSSRVSSSDEMEGKMLRRWRLKVQVSQRQQRKRRFSHPVCDL